MVPRRSQENLYKSNDFLKEYLYFLFTKISKQRGIKDGKEFSLMTVAVDVAM
jgi:hypothetical protein